MSSRRSVPRPPTKLNPLPPLSPSWFPLTSDLDPQAQAGQIKATGLDTGWITRCSASVSGTHPFPPPQHWTLGVIHGIPPAFMESPPPHPTAVAWLMIKPTLDCTTLHYIATQYSTSFYGIPAPSPNAIPGRPSQPSSYGQPLQSSDPGLRCTTLLHSTLPTSMEHPFPFPMALDTGCTIGYRTNLYGTPLPHPAAQDTRTVLHQPLLNPLPKALYAGCTTRYFTSLYVTPRPFLLFGRASGKRGCLAFGVEALSTCQRWLCYVVPHQP